MKWIIAYYAALLAFYFVCALFILRSLNQGCGLERVDVYRRIIGDSAHRHCSEWWKRRAEHCLHDVESGDRSDGKRIETSEALMHLGRDDEARAQLQALEPRMQWDSNVLLRLCILDGRAGRWQDAERRLVWGVWGPLRTDLWVERYYLPMIRRQWRDKTFAAPHSEGYPDFCLALELSHDFTGSRYDLFPGQATPGNDEDRERCLLGLIDEEPTFADGYLVLGDELFMNGDLPIALCCYVRARQLHHPAESEVGRRIDTVFSRWEQAATSLLSVSHARDRQIVVAEIERAFASAEARGRTGDEFEARAIARGVPFDYSSVPVVGSRAF